jgi:hypothetical protein
VSGDPSWALLPNSRAGIGARFHTLRDQARPGTRVYFEDEQGSSRRLPSDLTSADVTLAGIRTPSSDSAAHSEMETSQDRSRAPRGGGSVLEAGAEFLAKYLNDKGFFLNACV